MKKKRLFRKDFLCQECDHFTFNEQEDGVEIRCSHCGFCTGHQQSEWKKDPWLELERKRSIKTKLSNLIKAINNQTK